MSAPPAPGAANGSTTAADLPYGGDVQAAAKAQDREAIRALMAGRDIGEDEAEKRRKEELERRENALREAENQRRRQEDAELERRQAAEREAQLRAAEQAAREAALREAREQREAAQGEEAGDMDASHERGEVRVGAVVRGAQGGGVYAIRPSTRRAISRIARPIEKGSKEEIRATHS